MTAEQNDNLSACPRVHTSRHGRPMPILDWGTPMRCRTTSATLRSRAAGRSRAAYEASRLDVSVSCRLLTAVRQI
jgi:hypothetical protein